MQYQDDSATSRSRYLGAKLLPPRLVPTLLPRPRLVERLRSNLVRPVTLVTANAGSGKTTLVADFIRSQESPCVWYQLDQTDLHPSVFLGYITHGIRRFMPDFGKATLGYLQEAAAEVDQKPEHAVDILLNDVLDGIEEQLILVLDDYHHLGLTGHVHAAVDRLLAYLPDVIHTIIISRDVPPLRLARLRSQSALAIIDRDDLLFTSEETQALFRQVFDLELAPEQLAEYCELTQGWVTALQLIRRVLQRSPAVVAAPASGKTTHDAIIDLNEILRLSERDIFEYFSEEVFSDEHPNIQNLLLRASLLERIDIETCAHLYVEAQDTSVLPSLVRRNLFITIASDGQGEIYRLHPLFRSFLRRRLRAELNRTGLAAEHLRVAEYFLRNGNWEQGMRHLMEAEEFDKAASVIADKGREWVTTGLHALLSSTADAIPIEVMEKYPRALVHRAELYKVRGEHDNSQSMLRRAATLLHDLDDKEGEADALCSLAAIARRKGDISSAFEALDQAEALTNETSPIRMKCCNTRGLCLVSLGQWTVAEREFRTGLQFAEEQGDEYYTRLIVHNLGLPPLMRGDFREALKWLRRLSSGNQNSPSAVSLPVETAAHLNMARCYLLIGDFQSCEQRLNRAAELCNTFNLISMRAELFEIYGDLHQELASISEPDKIAEHYARAEEYYDLAAQDYETANVKIEQRELLESRAMLKLNLGDPIGARALIDQLLEKRRELSNEVGVQSASLALTRVMIAQKEFEETEKILEPLVTYFRGIGSYYYESQACHELALCDHHAGRDGKMLQHLRRMIDLAARYDYEYWVHRKAIRYPKMFGLPEVMEILPQELREQLADPTFQPKETTVLTQIQIASATPRADLTLNMLGPVEIFRDPLRQFAADAWTTRRARDILCFIGSRRHKRASKDMIIEIFWGEADAESITKNFHPTVSHIRKALNSNQPLKLNFLIYRDGDYQLNPEFSYSIDIVEFERLASEGDVARRASRIDAQIQCYEDAIKLYRDEFMQGCYEEWVEEQRQYYSEQYLHMLEVLVIAAQNTEEWARSLQLAQHILHKDQFREDIHCLIMCAHAAQGNRVAVKEQFESLRELLLDELGVEPEPETIKTYQRLMTQPSTGNKK